MRLGSVCAVLVVTLASGLVFGQEAKGQAAQAKESTWEEEQRKLFSVESRERFYEQAKLDVTDGMWRSAVLPGWGNVWADEVFKGVALLGCFGIGISLVGAGLWRDDAPFWIGGASLSGGCYVASLVTTYFDVRSYNTMLRRRYKLSQAPPRGVMWTWNF